MICSSVNSVDKNIVDKHARMDKIQANLKRVISLINFDVPKKIYINCILNCILMKRYKSFRLA